ncbi:MAG TPA: hypothetical protein VIH61_02175 [Waddliaceae bacterium]
MANPQDYYRFNSLLGFPEAIQPQMKSMLQNFKGQPIVWSGHAQDQAKNRMNLNQLPGNGRIFPSEEHGYSPVEVEHNGKDITKMVMRGPYSDNQDAVVPIIPSQGKPFAKTVWLNNKQDAHKSLDLNEVHLPDEFRPNQRPKRAFPSDLDKLQSSYKPLPHTRPGAVDKIKQIYGPKPKVAHILPRGKCLLLKYC